LGSTTLTVKLFAAPRVALPVGELSATMQEVPAVVGAVTVTALSAVVLPSAKLTVPGLAVHSPEVTPTETETAPVVPPVRLTATVVLSEGARLAEVEAKASVPGEDVDVQVKVKLPLASPLTEL
jgi:hypothetical protein